MAKKNRKFRPLQGIRALLRRGHLDRLDWYEGLLLVLGGELDRLRWQRELEVPEEWSTLLGGRCGPVRHAGSLRKLLEVVPTRIGFRLDGRETVGRGQLDYATGLFHLSNQRWRRPLDGWSPRVRTRRSAFSSLANHLLAEYPAPEFLAMAWLRPDDCYGAASLRLFLHVGAGNNPRTGDTPVPLTRRVAHHFLLAPAHYSIEGAVRWGQIAALGGTPRLADACVATRLGEHFGNEAFWMSVLRWFVAHPSFDPDMVGPAVDFIRDVKFESTWTNGVFTPAAQPGFSMAGRTPEALVRQMERWHAALGRDGARPPVVPEDDARPPDVPEAAAAAQVWPTGGIRGMQWKRKRRRVTTTWKIEALLSRRALYREGRDMHHCVASYADSCAAGECSIWSLKALVGDLVMERATVEVSRDRVVVQARGKCNAWPDGEALDVLRRWARKENLTVPAWL